MKSLKVGLIYDDTLDRYGGVGQYCITLGSALMRRGHDVTLLVGDTQADAVQGIPVMSLSRNLKVRFNGNALSVPFLSDGAAIRSLADVGFDVLHVQMPYSPLLAGRLIAQADSRCAVIGTFHVASNRPLVRLGARALATWSRKTLDRVDQVVVVSETANQFARTTFGLRDAIRVPNMTPVAGPQPVPHNTAPIVTFVGRLERRKGVIQLVREFEVVRDRFPNATLYVVGEGSHRSEIENVIRRRGLKESVHLLGAVAPGTRDFLLAQSDVACFPSTFGESFGIVLIEAMSAGAGVVLGGRNDGHQEVLENDAAVIVDARVSGDIASKVIAVLSDRKLANALHERQQEIVALYDVDDVVERVLATYNDVLALRRLGVELTPAGAER